MYAVGMNNMNLLYTLIIERRIILHAFCSRQQSVSFPFLLLWVQIQLKSLALGDIFLRAESYNETVGKPPLRYNEIKDALLKNTVYEANSLTGRVTVGRGRGVKKLAHQLLGHRRRR